MTTRTYSLRKTRPVDLINEDSHDACVVDIYENATTTNKPREETRHTLTTQKGGPICAIVKLVIEEGYRLNSDGLDVVTTTNEPPYISDRRMHMPFAQEELIEFFKQFNYRSKQYPKDGEVR